MKFKGNGSMGDYRIMMALKVKGVLICFVVSCLMGNDSGIHEVYQLSNLHDICTQLNINNRITIPNE